MFSWRFRLYTWGITLFFAASAFFLVYVFQHGSFFPAWPYFLAILFAALVNQLVLLRVIRRMVKY